MAPSLYSFSEETLQRLGKFRFSSARAHSMEALIYHIDTSSYEIKAETDVITSLEDLVDEVPDSSPRFILLSYPITLQDGRKSSPLVLVYFRPQTSTQEGKMLYAGAVELFRNKAGVNKVLDIDEEEELLDIPDLLQH
ncbi:hypothetical protein LJB42_001105 [Komagataella kurtzmanii]|nr:hypothetical protein LJB42_001105 [Komagataella kurtzmanii]